MISPAAMQNTARTSPTSGGHRPFKFVEWKPTDYLKVAKFDDYWKKGLPKVDRITWSRWWTTTRAPP